MMNEDRLLKCLEKGLIKDKRYKLGLNSVKLRLSRAEAVLYFSPLSFSIDVLFHVGLQSLGHLSLR